MTVADGWALGWVTDHVLAPAFASGHTTTGALLSIVALFLGIAVLRAIGVVGRRTLAGVMQYRLQATYRRRVTRQYLRLPLEWHHRNPTGSLMNCRVTRRRYVACSRYCTPAARVRLPTTH